MRWPGVLLYRIAGVPRKRFGAALPLPLQVSSRIAIQVVQAEKLSIFCVHTTFKTLVGSCYDEARSQDLRSGCRSWTSTERAGHCDAPASPDTSLPRVRSRRRSSSQSSKLARCARLRDRDVGAFASRQSFCVPCSTCFALLPQRSSALRFGYGRVTGDANLLQQQRARPSTDARRKPSSRDNGTGNQRHEFCSISGGGSE